MQRASATWSSAYHDWYDVASSHHLSIYMGRIDGTEKARKRRWLPVFIVGRTI